MSEDSKYERSPLHRFGNYSTGVLRVVISNDEKWVLSGSMDGSVRLWELNSGSEVRRFSGHKGAVQALAFSNDLQLIASSGMDGLAKVWNIKNGKEIWRLDPYTSEDRKYSQCSIYAVAFSNNRNYFAFGYPGIVHLYDTNSRKLLRKYELDVGAYEWNMAFAPDDSHIRGTTSSSIFRLNIDKHWSFSTNRLSLLSSKIAATDFVDHGLVAYSNGNLILWDLLKELPLNMLKGHSGSPQSLSQDCHHALIAVSRGYKDIDLVHIDTGKVLCRLLGHTEHIQDAVFSGTGCLAVSCSAGNNRGDLLAWQLK